MIFLLSCSGKDGDMVLPDKDEVHVEFRIPRTFASGPEIMTKSDIIDGLNENDHSVRKLLDPDIMLGTLPPGSTLWMMYSEKIDGTTYSEQELRAYRVLSDAGYHSLYACQVVTDRDSGGNITGYHMGEMLPDEPLILQNGKTYRFKMVSPAYDLTSDFKIPVDNGMYLYSSDGRYWETRPTEITVNSNDISDGHYVMYVTLNPMVQQVARMNFTIVRDQDSAIHSIEMLPAGIEISGLQNPYDPDDGEQAKFNWSSQNVEDMLPVKRGDKQSWVTIPGDKVWVNEEPLTYTWKDGTTQTYPKQMRADIGVLPTNAQSTTIIITFNLLVNGIPTQYVTTLNQGVTAPGQEFFSNILEQGHSYDMILKVGLKDDIFVFTWQYQSWSYDLTLTPKS